MKKQKEIIIQILKFISPLVPNLSDYKSHEEERNTPGQKVYLKDGSILLIQDELIDDFPSGGFGPEYAIKWIKFIRDERKK